MNKVDRDKHLAGEYRAGEEAKEVTEHPLFKGAILTYKAMLFESFTLSSTTDTEKRENIYRQMKALDSVEANLIELVETGKLALDELNITEIK